MIKETLIKNNFKFKNVMSDMIHGFHEVWGKDKVIIGVWDDHFKVKNNSKIYKNTIIYKNNSEDIKKFISEHLA